jgi:hypothetical protein
MKGFILGSIVIFQASCMGNVLDPPEIGEGGSSGTGRGGATGSGGAGGDPPDSSASEPGTGGIDGSGGAESGDAGRAREGGRGGIAGGPPVRMDAGGDRPADAGAAPPGDGGADGPIMLTCTSNMRWNGRRGPLMHPGRSCPMCHRAFTIAGTVYPTLHEPTDCNGSDGLAGQINVVITDAAGKVLTLPVNSAGNFFTKSAVALPFRAKVVANGTERMMVLPQMVGACNSCHTPYGDNKAPGRIMSP